MKASSKCLRNCMITGVTLIAAFFISLLFQHFFDVQEHITTVFVFAVFLVSLATKGYLYGIAASVIGTFAVNYAFTFPLFTLDFHAPVNMISGIIMFSIAALTSTLIAKLKRHEAQKAESEKEYMRANLLRAVSHDLRTPLTTIYGSSTTLLENEDVLTSEQKQKIVLGIKEESEWLMRMVENLLSITRIDNGRVKIIKTPTVLEELVDSVIVKFKKRYPAQKVIIEIPDKMVIIPMDAILIEQVIINILENAVQHAKGMTQLVLRVDTVGKQAIFEISDNGCGINPRRIETLFTGYCTDEIKPADSSRRNAGIGLSVCATIIKAHGGNITAENARTGGAVFRFALDTEETGNDSE